MKYFFKRHGVDNDGFQFKPVSPLDSDEVLTERTKGLVGDEFEIYKWLREYYSDRWIAETLLLDIWTAKYKIRTVCRKLGVRNKKSLIQVYGRLPRPRKGPVDTEEIDRYTDEREEEDIRRSLNAEQAGKEDNTQA